MGDKMLIDGYGWVLENFIYEKVIVVFCGYVVVFSLSYRIRGFW